MTYPTPRVSSHESDSVGSEGCKDCYRPSGDCAPPWPWANMSIWCLMSWKLTGSNQKSNEELTCLVKEVIQAPDFKIADLAKFHALTELRRLGDEGTRVAGVSGAFSHDGWKEATLEISIPIREQRKEDCGHSFAIPGLMYRSLVSVIQIAFSEPISQWFHFIHPLKQHHSPPPSHGDKINVCSPPMLHDDIQSLASPPLAHDTRLIFTLGWPCHMA